VTDQMKLNTRTMTAADIRLALRKRWPDSDYLFVEEAPENSDRSGTKIDVLVVALWRSRGLERDAVEIKVSMSDFRKEIEKPAKADFWWGHSHRFWIACPETMAAKALEELPSTWGLLVVRGEGDAVQSTIKKRAPSHEPAPLTWSTAVGLARASANAGLAALSRAEQRGYDRGREAGKREAVNVVQANPKAVEEARRQMDAFKSITGVHFTPVDWGEEFGRAVRVVMDWKSDPRRAARLTTEAVDQLQRTAAELSNVAEAIKALTAERAA
jgi:hypothetical protein